LNKGYPGRLPIILADGQISGMGGTIVCGCRVNLGYSHPWALLITGKAPTEMPLWLRERPKIKRSSDWRLKTMGLYVLKGYPE